VLVQTPQGMMTVPASQAAMYAQQPPPTNAVATPGQPTVMPLTVVTTDVKVPHTPVKNRVAYAFVIVLGIVILILGIIALVAPWYEIGQSFNDAGSESSVDITFYWNHYDVTYDPDPANASGSVTYKDAHLDHVHKDMNACLSMLVIAFIINFISIIYGIIGCCGYKAQRVCKPVINVVLAAAETLFFLLAFFSLFGINNALKNDKACASYNTGSSSSTTDGYYCSSFMGSAIEPYGYNLLWAPITGWWVTLVALLFSIGIIALNGFGFVVASRSNPK